MKKNPLIGLAALAAVTITSCQKDQVINQVPQEQAIEFGTYVGRDAMTKGSSTTTATIQAADAGFGVFAYYTDNSDYASTTIVDQVTIKGSKLNFMNNQHVTYSTDKWIYSPLKYWPNDPTDKLSFFAYAPYKEGLQLYSGYGDPITTISVDDDVTNHIDFTYANDGNTSDGENNLIDQTKQTISGNINFVFQHAMSRVGFKVEAIIDAVNGDDENDTTQDDSSTESPDTALDNQTTISIQEIELIGNFWKTASLNLNGGTWSNWIAAEPQERKFTLNSSDFNSYTITNTKSTAINKDTEYMMLIPQNFDAKDAHDNEDNSDMIAIRVKYTVTTTDSAFDTSNGSGDGVVAFVNDITSDKFKFNFEQGKAYNFVLHLGLTSVKLSATVNPWDETNSDIAVNVPINTPQP